MMKQLKIAKDLWLPLDAVTQKLAWLGRTGSGKTYGASKLAEEMLGADAQVVILDCVGVWYGLRLDANGGPAFKIPVFGGLHGDVPLEPTGGALMADLIVDRGLSIVLDVSQFESDAMKARFAGDWADRFFFRKKASPSAVHVFVEECQEFVPQNPQRGEERMLHAFQRLEKLGRNFGIGMSLISQRPQEVNKKALNQTECLFAFQMTGPQERKAIEAWVSEKGAELDIVSQLPRLGVGQCHVWSPQWLDMSETIDIAPKRTFNASSTPEVGRSRAVRELGAIDVAALKTAMAATIERAKADDPKELRKRIAALEAEARAWSSRRTPTSVTPAPKRVEVATLKDAQIKRLEAAIQRMRDTEAAAAKVLANWTDKLSQRQQVVVSEAGMLRDALTKAADRSIGGSVAAWVPTKVQPFVGVKVNDDGRRPPTMGRPSGAGRDRILAALALRDRALTRAELGVFSVLSSKGGTFTTYVPQLLRDALIASDGKGLRITAAGLAALQAPPQTVVAADAEGLQDAWRDELAEGGMQRIFDSLLRSFPEWITREELGKACGLEYKGGTFTTYFPKLKRLGLVEVVDRKVRASRHLFEGAA